MAGFLAFAYEGYYAQGEDRLNIDIYDTATDAWPSFRIMAGPD